MINETSPVRLFSIASSSADITTLDSNIGDVDNAIPDDLKDGFKNAGHQLSGSETIMVLSRETNWLITDGLAFYQVKLVDKDLIAYSITAARAKVLKTQAKVGNGVAALNIITTACHAILNTQLVAPPAKPSWFDDLNSKLDNAKVLAQQWVDDIAPVMTAKLPNQVINYGTTYTAVTDQIVSIANQHPSAKGKDDPHVQEVFDLINALKSSVSQIETNLETEDSKLTTWGNQMQTAHNDLFDGVANIQAAEVDLQADINKMNEAIKALHEKIKGEEKIIAYMGMAIGIGLLAIVAGIALAPETGGLSLIVAGTGALTVIGGAVTWGVMQHRIDEQFDEIAKDQKELDADKRQLVALQGLSMATNKALTSITTATNALSKVKTMWKLFEGELAGVIDKLNLAKQDLALIVNEAFVNGANSEWQLAGQFAQQLIATPTKTESRTLSMDSKAA